MTQLYDEIGIGYRDYRRPDSRIYTPILRFLGEARTIVDVGAGTGSSEPIGRSVVAVEPSLAMIRDRQPESAPVVQGTATDLPFRDGVFDAGVAILTVHHWPDQARGLTELARLAVNRIVILTSDLAALNFWLIDDYFPGIADIDLQIMPSIETFRQMFNLI